MRILFFCLLLGFSVLCRPAPAEEAPQPFQIDRSAVHTLAASGSKRQYPVTVVTPPGYARPENADRRYPVIYLTDAPYTVQVTAGVSRLLFSQKKMEEFIIVGIGYAVGEPGTPARNRDLTPWANANYPGTGGAPAFLDFIVNDAMPEMERRYRIDPARRTLAGQSYGGLFGLWTLLTRPGLFESYILTSPSIWFARQALLDLEAAAAKRSQALTGRVYFATGGFETINRASDDPRYYTKVDMVADQRQMADRLRDRAYPGLQVRADVIEGTVHETTFPVGLVHALHWLFPYLGD